MQHPPLPPLRLVIDEDPSPPTSSPVDALWRSAHLLVVGRRESDDAPTVDAGISCEAGGDDDDDDVFGFYVGCLAAVHGRRRVGVTALLAAAAWREKGHGPPPGPRRAIWGPSHRAWVQAGLDDDAIFARLRALLRAS